MPPTSDIVVLKFGSSVLRSVADLPAAVHEIYRWYRRGARIIAVVSALGETTERLLAQARQLSSDPNPAASAELLATGERGCAALLGVALDRAGVPARLLDPREIRLTVMGNALDSEPVGVDRERLEAMLEETPVVIVPGFFGIEPGGRTQLLGRGGSDLSAVFLAVSVRAKRCRLLKDVDGVYESDPALAVGQHPRRFTSLGYADALRVAGPLIQSKAVQFLDRFAGQAEVAGLALPYESVVHAGVTTLAGGALPGPTAVILLGLGTVGFGVYQRLGAMPEHFFVAGALVRNRAKYEALEIPANLLDTSEEAVLNRNAAVVVDALPGSEPSQRLVRAFLARGCDVVSANKVLIREFAPQLAMFHAKDAAALRYSATVGGSAPMIEAVQTSVARGPIRSIAAVLNGTCNFVLDRCAEGASFDEAVGEARARGFAEADPSDDLLGRDAERKLRILARHAFGEDPHAVTLEGLSAASAQDARELHASGMRLRQVASAQKEGGRLLASVKLQRVPAEHPFAHAELEWNCLLITGADGRVTTVNGRGAGRWPTTEAVLADLIELRCERMAARATAAL